MEVESFLLSIAANFATEGIKKIWQPIRRLIVGRGVTPEAVGKFEANDPQGRAAIQQALEELLKNDPSYLEEIKKADKKLRKLLDPSGGQKIKQKITTGNGSPVVAIAGNGNTVGGSGK